MGCNKRFCRHGWLMRFDNCQQCKDGRKAFDVKWLRYEPDVISDIEDLIGLPPGHYSVTYEVGAELMRQAGLKP